MGFKRYQRLRGKTPAVLSKVKVSLPFGIGEAEWTPDPTECRAARALYVELVTHIAVQPLEPGQGLLREALSSLHSLFGTTREILREAGPKVGISRESVGGIAIAVLNHEDGLRPFLSKWHPLLMSWEAQRQPDVDPAQHELTWTYNETLRGEMDGLRRRLEGYAESLSKIAGVQD